MEKRAFLAVILSIAVFYLFSFFFGPDKKPQVPSQGNPPADVAPAAPAMAPGLPSGTTPSPVPTERNTGKDVSVDTASYTAVFSSRGGVLKYLALKNYRETPKGKPVVLGDNADPNLPNLSTRATGFNLPDSTIYTANVEALQVADNQKGQLVFSSAFEQGYVVRKIFTFTGNSYVVKVETQVVNNSATPLVGTIQQVLTYPAEPKVKDNRFETAGFYLFGDNSLKSDKAKDVAGASKRYDKNVLWAGFADKYFLTALLSNNNSLANVELKKNAAGYLESIASSPQFTVTPGQSTTIEQKLFVGPKDIDILKSVGNSLEHSLDLGWFAVIAKPLLYTLKFFYRYVGNYGIAIIIITIILKVLFFPLTHKSYKSMKDMQKLQPKDGSPEREI